MKDKVKRVKKAGIFRIIGYVYQKLRLVGRRIRYNYYLRNCNECTRNKKLLNKARSKTKSDTSNKNPLVSVLIPTYNRGKVLTERTIPSVLRQTYQNFEIVIVGDHCTDKTEELLNKFRDARIKFYNLPKRGDYPSNQYDRWCVAGVAPANKAVELCTGEWIAPLDDDDEFSEDHLEVLLHYALEHNYEMVYGVVQMEMKTGEWIKVGSSPLEYRKICHLSVLYHSNLKLFRYDINSWKYGEPADWNKWRRMKEAGVRVGFIDKVVGKHFLEGIQRGI